MKIPKLIHSHEETAVLAYLIHAFGQKCTVESIFDCQIRGDNHLLIDGILELPHDGNSVYKLGIEYDGGYFHNDSLLKRDIVKSTQLLEKYKDLVLVRIRQNAAPMSHHLHPRSARFNFSESHPEVGVIRTFRSQVGLSLTRDADQRRQRGSQLSH